MFAVLLCLMPFRRRRAMRSLAAVLLLGGLTAVSGCGSGVRAFISTSSSAGSYTVTVTGTGTPAGSSVPVTASTTFALTVN